MIDETRQENFFRKDSISLTVFLWSPGRVSVGETMAWRGCSGWPSILTGGLLQVSSLILPSCPFSQSRSLKLLHTVSRRRLKTPPV